MQPRQVNITNWDNLELHPLCTMFPEMGEKDFDALLESMRTQGFSEYDPITLIFDDENDDWLILDGQNRFYAAKQTNVTPHFVQYKGDDPLAFVTARNLDRRHLTTGQKAAIAASIADLGAGIKQADAAKQLGIGEASLRRYKFIEKHDPKLAKEVADGKTAMEEARQRIKNMESNMKRPEEKKNEGYKLGDKRREKLAKLTNTEVTIHASFVLSFDPEKTDYATALEKAMAALEKGGLNDVEVINEGDE